MSANPLFQRLKPDVEKLIRYYSSPVQLLHVRQPDDPQAFTLPAELGDTVTRFIASVMLLALGDTQATVEERKAAVLEAVQLFWTYTGREVLQRVLGGPSLVVDQFILPYLERQIPSLVYGMYDALLSIVSRYAGQSQAAPTEFVPY